MTRYGYARVSTKDQKLDRQIEALVNAGVPYGHIYKDKVTGAKDGDRTQQKRLFKKMKAGDEVVVESWERLTRSTRQLLNYDLMFRNLGVKLTSLKQPVDLDTAFGRFVLGTHACTAELERDLIKQRQAEGIAVKRSHDNAFFRVDSDTVTENACCKSIIRDLISRNNGSLDRCIQFLCCTVYRYFFCCLFCCCRLCCRSVICFCCCHFGIFRVFFPGEPGQCE